MLTPPWYEFDVGVSSRKKKRRVDVYSRNIRPDILRCTTNGERDGGGGDGRGGAASASENKWFNERRAGNPTVAVDREMREGKRDTR